MATASTVYVKDISSFISKEQISELFGCCGAITQFTLRQESDGKKSAVISYADPTQATAAVALSGTTLGDCAFSVAQTPFEAKPAPSPADAIHPERQQFVNADPGVGQPSSTAVADPSTQEALMQAQLKREEEISRTIYVGNLRPDISEDQLAEFLSSCGEVVCVKHCNNTVGEGEQKVRYSFVEFSTRHAALTAMGLGGTLFAGRPIKVGKALNPIIKNSKTMAKKQTLEGKKLSLDSDIMRRVLMYAAKITRKIEKVENGGGDEDGEGEGGDRSRSRSSRRRRRDRSRDRSPEDRDRRRRNRSRSRERRRRR